jgi:hypothetical protein
MLTVWTSSISEIWWVGEKGRELNMTDYSHSKYYEVCNPKKEKACVQPDCNYTKEIVTDTDNGNWTFLFGIDGKLMEDTIDKKIIVRKGKGTRLL